MPRFASLSRARSLAVIATVYAVAIGFAAVTLHFLPSNLAPSWQLGALSLAGTLAIFAFSVLLDNSSAFDAYWSAAPLATLPWLLLARPALDARSVLVAAVVSVWGLRLTWNWIRQWRGLGHEDFRYVDQRRSAGRAYWLVSLLGIHLMPALLVWLGSLSLIPATSSSAPLGALDVLGAALAIAATWLEATADRQLRDFVTTPHPPAAICDRGVWSWSRHPNYLGEILFWWGLFLLALGADRGAVRCAIGPAAITLLFNAISIPLMEKRMAARRPTFAAHCRRVSRLLLWPPARGE